MASRRSFDKRRCLRRRVAALPFIFTVHYFERNFVGSDSIANVLLKEVHNGFDIFIRGHILKGYAMLKHGFNLRWINLSCGWRVFCCSINFAAPWGSWTYEESLGWSWCWHLRSCRSFFFLVGVEIRVHFYQSQSRLIVNCNAAPKPTYRRYPFTFTSFSKTPRSYFLDICIAEYLQH